MIDDVTVIVLTPVRNEEWIMDQFLKLTSLFADYIIVADQFSTDNTAAIIKRHPKAVYLKNDNPEFDEHYRQTLLIEKARELVPGKKLLLALDADEFIASDSIGSLEWSVISRQAPGTRIFFKKPDILSKGKRYTEYDDYFLLGYIDDGKPHQGVKMHSPRVPQGSSSYKAQDIRFLHLAMIRELEYNAKQRVYSVIENVNKTDGLRIRYRKYARKIQHSRMLSVLNEVPAPWIELYPQIGVNIAEFPTSEDNSYNKRLLGEFDKYGTKRFWMDDIWYVDYHQINEQLGGICKAKISYPPFWISMARSFYIHLYAGLLRITKRI